jgi:hypothetical protein
MPQLEGPCDMNFGQEWVGLRVGVAKAGRRNNEGRWQGLQALCGMLNTARIDTVAAELLLMVLIAEAALNDWQASSHKTIQHQDKSIYCVTFELLPGG